MYVTDWQHALIEGTAVGVGTHVDDEVWCGLLAVELISLRLSWLENV